MLGIGWTEMLIIGIVALIVIGPKDLPVMMKRVGQFAGSIRRMGSEFQREINRSTGLDEIKSLRTSITAPLKKTADEIKREFNLMTPTGIKPTGVIKPADPKVESVVDEIKTAAGMTPVGAVLTAAVPAAAADGEATPSAPGNGSVKGKRPGKGAVPTAAVAVAELKPAATATRKVRSKAEAAASPAPIEAIAPVKDEPLKTPVKRTPPTPRGVTSPRLAASKPKIAAAKS